MHARRLITKPTCNESMMHLFLFQRNFCNGAAFPKNEKNERMSFLFLYIYITNSPKLQMSCAIHRMICHDETHTAHTVYENV